MKIDQKLKVGQICFENVTCDLVLCLSTRMKWKDPDVISLMK